jgi:hypothetical protein
MSNDAVRNVDDLLTLISDFGPGVLSWAQADGLHARPIMPVIDRPDHRVVIVADDVWFRGARPGRLDVVLSFVDEFGLRALTVRADMLRSQRTADLDAAWTAEADRLFPDGPTQKNLVCLQITPDTATLWQLGEQAPVFEWRCMG